MTDYSSRFIPVIAEILRTYQCQTVLDPMSDTGKIALIQEYYPCKVYLTSEYPLPYEPGKFDAIVTRPPVLRWGLGYRSKVLDVYLECERVLKPGGILILNIFGTPVNWTRRLFLETLQFRLLDEKKMLRRDRLGKRQIEYIITFQRPG